MKRLCELMLCIVLVAGTGLVTAESAIGAPCEASKHPRDNRIGRFFSDAPTRVTAITADGGAHIS